MRIYCSTQLLLLLMLLVLITEFRVLDEIVTGNPPLNVVHSTRLKNKMNLNFDPRRRISLTLVGETTRNNNNGQPAATIPFVEQRRLHSTEIVVCSSLAFHVFVELSLVVVSVSNYKTERLLCDNVEGRMCVLAGGLPLPA